MKKKIVAGIFAALCCVGVNTSAGATEIHESRVQTNLVERIRTADKIEEKAASESFADRIAGITNEYNAGDKGAAAIERPKVVILYVNHAKSTYDDAVDKEIFKYLNAALPEREYELVDGEPFIEKLNNMGYMDLSMVERADYTDAFAGENIDYCIYLEVQPFVARDKVTFFTVGKDITTAVLFRMVNLGTGRYIYNGKYTEKASDSTMIGGIGNKSVALKAIDSVGEKMLAEIKERLPKERSIAE